jgi:peptidyl-tRNA hydrolase, PTH2 family
MKVKQIIVMRKDLKCRRGKMMAQAAHASMKVILDKMRKIPYSVVSNNNKEGKFTEYTLTVSGNSALEQWLDGSFTKVVVGVDSLEELMEIHSEAKAMGMLTSIIEDEGRTEFHGEKTVTCVAIGPDTVERVDRVTGHLKLL